MVKYLSRRQMVLINEKLLRFFGKEKGEANGMYLEAVSTAAKGYPGEGRDALLAKAAIMLERIVVMKPFSSGNDRTAYEAARVFLESNGIILDAEEKDIVALLMDVAGFRKDIGAVHKWIAQHTPPPQEKARKSPAKTANKEKRKPAEKEEKGKYAVFVDDNFHHGDESERYKLGDFGSCEDAVKACRKIVDEYFGKIEGKHTFDELWHGYTTYGEDPFIVCDDEGCRFSAWDYAKKRCRELARN